MEGGWVKEEVLLARHRLETLEDLAFLLHELA
jgi:hypothetical protein